MENVHEGGLAPAEKELAAGGLQWHYLEWNTGDQVNNQPNILLVHGVTSDARAWWKLGAELALAGAHVVALDMPGHGTTSDSPTDVKWQTTAAQVAAFAAALGWDKPGYRLVGHSWGGLTSLGVAAGHPAGLEKVALLDPALYMEHEWAASEAAHSSADVGVPKKSWDEYLAYTQENLPKWTDSDRYWKAGAMVAYRPETVRDFFTQNSGENVSGLLAKIEVPLLLVISDETVGGIIPPQTQVEARAALRPGKGQSVRYAGVGHNIQREDYARLTADLRPFLLNS